MVAMVLLVLSTVISDFILASWLRGRRVLQLKIWTTRGPLFLDGVGPAVAVMK